MIAGNFPSLERDMVILKWEAQRALKTKNKQKNTLIYKKAFFKAYCSQIVKKNSKSSKIKTLSHI